MTQEALKESIDVWKQKLREDNPLMVHIGTEVCPLCALYNHPAMLEDDRCKGCSIFEATGKQDCEGSPYGEAAAAVFLWKLRGRIYKQQFREAAQKMIRFMQALVEAK